MTELDYSYGPTESDPDPGKMWHKECGGEVWTIEDGLICSKCNQSSTSLDLSLDQVS